MNLRGVMVLEEKVMIFRNCKGIINVGGEGKVPFLGCA
jgi:hypothetical protein